MDVQLILVKGARKRQALRLRSEETIIGRRDGSDVRIPSAQVSRRHCRLSFQDDVLRAEDLDSANGTFLNGQRLSGVQVVRPGDRLEVGPVTFEVKYQLSQKAIDQLLREEAPVEAPMMDVEELTELDAAPVEEAVADALVLEDLEDSETVQLEMVDAESATPSLSASTKKAKTKKAKTKKDKDKDKDAEEVVEADAVEPADAELIDEIFENRDRWQEPGGEDIRDILSKLDE
jgi:pSer/pThr/pTyr-binding forkhead associated (FHA) protein